MEGNVDIQDLICKDFFVILEPAFLKKLKASIKKNKTYPQLIKELYIPKRILERSLNGKSAIRIDVLSKFIEKSKFNWESVKESIKELRGKLGGRIINPKFPFDFTTKAGVRLIAALFGDGCLSKKYYLLYSNSNMGLINGFIKDAKQVFGNSIIYAVRDYHPRHVKTVELAPVYGRIVSKLGILAGKKVENNVSIPEFIFRLDDGKRAEFLAQIFDDEGSVNLYSRHLKINFALVKSHERCDLIEDIRRLFESFNILVSVYKQKGYKHCKGKRRVRWQLEIHGLLQFKILYPILNLRHKEKKKKFKELIDSIKNHQYLKRNVVEVYLNYMKQIEKEKGYFTSFDIAEASDRAVGSCRNLLNKFIKLGLVKKIQPYYGGNLRTPARYIVKNENHRRFTHSQQV